MLLKPVIPLGSILAGRNASKTSVGLEVPPVSIRYTGQSTFTNVASSRHQSNHSLLVKKPMPTWLAVQFLRNQPNHSSQVEKFYGVAEGRNSGRLYRLGYCSRTDNGLEIPQVQEICYKSGSRGIRPQWRQCQRRTYSVEIQRRFG